MLVEIAIADSYGAGFEFADPSEGRPNDLSFFVRNPRYHKLHPGMYTDDGQMSLAIAEALLNGQTTREGFAEAFVICFKRDPRDGYARGFQAFLESIDDPMEFLQRIEPKSDRSGAAMRVAPIGLVPDMDTVLHLSALQARITHDTVMGVAAAQGAALMVHHQAFDFGTIEELPEFLADLVPEIDWLDPFRGRTRNSGEEIVRAALAVLLDTRTLSGVLRRAVEFGGDTDTVAAIAMGAASVSKGMKRDLPQVLYANLESGPYGIDYLREADRKLAAKYPALREFIAG